MNDIFDITRPIYLIVSTPKSLPKKTTGARIGVSENHRCGAPLEPVLNRSLRHGGQSELEPVKDLGLLHSQNCDVGKKNSE